MTSYAAEYTEEQPEQKSGFLSRLFNAFAPQKLKDFVQEYKDQLETHYKCEAIELEENHSRHIRNLYHLAFTTAKDVEDPEHMKEVLQYVINANEEYANEYGQITLEDLLQYQESISEDKKAELLEDRAEFWEKQKAQPVEQETPFLA